MRYQGILALAIFDNWHALFDDMRAEVRWLKFDWRKASGRVILSITASNSIRFLLGVERPSLDAETDASLAISLEYMVRLVEYCLLQNCS